MSQTNNNEQLVHECQMAPIPLKDISQLITEFPSGRSFLESLLTQQLLRINMPQGFGVVTAETFFFLAQCLYYLGAIRINASMELLNIYYGLPKNDIILRNSRTNDLQWDPITKALKIPRPRVDFKYIFKAIFVLTQGLHLMEVNSMLQMISASQQWLNNYTQNSQPIEFSNGSKFQSYLFVIALLELYVDRNSLATESTLYDLQRSKELLGLNKCLTTDVERYLQMAMPINSRLQAVPMNL